MKKLLLILLLNISVPTMAICQDYLDGLKILNPSWGGQKEPAHFDSIKIKITPSGIYANVDVDLELSAKNSYFAYNDDSLEIEYKFALPKGSFIHEAWLWMGNTAVQASLYEKEKARFIYESLVNRRIDPLIIYKNDNQTFEARIFPVLGTAPRKVKFSLLIPIKANAKAIELPLPLSMFRSDINNNIPNIEIDIVNNSNWGNPITPEQASSSSTTGNITHISLPANRNTISSVNGIYFENYNKDGFFVTEESDVAGEGYFQLMLPRKDSVSQHQHLIFAIDFINNSSSAYQEVWNALKYKINYELTNKDSFNIIYTSNGNVHQVSNQWLAADPILVNTLINTLSNTTINSSNLNYEVINKVIQFNNTSAEKGKILLITNQKSKYNSATECNVKLNMLVNNMSAPMPINIIHLGAEDQYDFYIGNTPYSNNNYFLSNLSSLTGGFYFTRLYETIDFYYNSYRSIGEMLNLSFAEIAPKTVFDELEYDFSGILTDEFKVPYQINTNQRDAYMLVGKYYLLGSDSIAFKRTFKIGNTIYENSYQFDFTPNSLSLTKKIWGGNLLYQIETLSNNNDYYTNEIIDNSLRYHILATKTAFLALEPDTVNYRVDNVGQSSILESESLKPLTITAIPNPFTGFQTIKMELTTALQNKEWELQITDVTGKVVYSKKGRSTNTNSLYISWNGEKLNEGIYLATLKIGQQKGNMKIIKQ